MAITNFDKVDVASASGFSVAGVPITATPAELNAVSGSGLVAADVVKLHAINATAVEINYVAAGRVALDRDGLSSRGIARVTFDAGIVANRAVGAKVSAVTLPINAIVIGGFFDVNTLFTSVNANNGTIAIHVEGAADIQAGAAVSGAPYSSIGRKPIVPKNNTPDSTSVKCTAARAITFTVAVSDLLTGKLTLFLEYVVSAVSA